MLRTTRLLVLWLLVCPGAAWAANPDWVTLGGQPCNFAPGKACFFQATTTAVADSDFLQTLGIPFSLRIDGQIDGADTSCQVDVYACTRTDGNGDGTQDTTACSPLEWDTDADGLVDDNTLDQTNDQKVGTPVFMGIPYIYLDVVAAPGAGTCEVTATGEAVR